tara:strand:- start:58 stop:261 length:204 start_codon:yes stop_codon:yes gene_type:complete
MELIDTPNPNAKKIITEAQEHDVREDLYKIEGVSSVFFGPNFVTITKEENTEWGSINQDIINIFDRL